ncbi:putative secreted protein (plasmid) [Pseudomonas cerasi]|uniref:Putative secreted protein n=1 Tax=Pseudomonas cerasi TaxID=1583341 RepID=A0A193SGX9_9PSED|nr:putative secreted protein [Pseudomonas cerasi]CZT26198.1 putative secreted protein [Pseudomonas cerasi]SOS30195.1 putative secreted protein [Pseudomonas cerasi]SOS30272.1 putative secreted protein [Pseudomonas cerasi]
MNVKLALSGLLSAALLSGCGSAPKLSEPEGQWEDMPFTHAPAPRAAPVTTPAPLPGQVQPAASPAPQAQPLKTTQQKRPVTASPAKPAEAPPNDSKCSAN